MRVFRGTLPVLAMLLLLLPPAAGRAEAQDPPVPPDTLVADDQETDTLGPPQPRRRGRVLPWRTTPAPRPAAAALQARPPGEHVVRRGDTLWDLAARYFSDPWLWPRIFEANRRVVRDPHWIYPAERLTIPDREGSRAMLGEPVAEDAVAAAAPDEVDAERADEAAVRSAATDDPVPVEGPVSPAEFAAAPWLAADGSLRPLGRLLRVVDQGTSTGANPSPRPVRPHDEVYLEVTGTVREGERYLLARRGRRLGDWGRVVEPTAFVRVLAGTAGVVTAEVVHQFRAVETGDAILPVAQEPSFTAARAEPVMDGRRGRIVGFVEDQPLYDTSDHAFVDLGAASGARVGDEVEVLLPEREARLTAGELPTEVVARLLVVKVADRTATARVISVSQAVLRPGLPVRVHRKMP